MYILGISAFYHDSAACILKDGEIIAAAQEERFTRIKHDHHFPEKSILFCLQQAGITADQLDHVSFYERPKLKFDRLIKTYFSYAPKGLFSFATAMPLWIREKLWIGNNIRRKLGYKGKLFYPEHHQSHAASAFFPSPFERAAVLTMDGVGEWATTSFGVGEKNRLVIQQEIHFPHSLGLLYSAFTYYTGFKVNSGEYKLMGLAPYGNPLYVDTIYKHLVDVKEDGSFRLNMRYFNYCTGFTMTNQHFDQLFGRAPRKPESAITQLDMDLARSIQVVTEEIVLRIAKHVHRQTGEKNLCLAGGVALNCVSNGRLYREGPFERIWVQPAAGDAGGALGAALHVWYNELGNERKPLKQKADHQSGSRLGTFYDDDAIESFLQQKDIPYKKLAPQQLADDVASLLADENVIGWFNGKMEFGPRALGSRSILGDPRSKTMQSQMNLKIKFRESFRPFAPAVLAEKTKEWFDMAGVEQRSDFSSPYMLIVGHVQKSKTQETAVEKAEGFERLKTVNTEIPAVTHVDNSARIQTVHEETNPDFHRLLEAFEKKTGCPVLINTSFNVRGEPIVESPDDAYRCFMRTGIDYLVLGSFLLDKREQPELIETKDWRNEFKLD